MSDCYGAGERCISDEIIIDVSAFLYSHYQRRPGHGVGGSHAEAFRVALPIRYRL